MRLADIERRHPRRDTEPDVSLRRSSHSSASVVCCILAPAGPARLRMLSSLYRDDRAPSLSSFPVLSKMFLENVIRPAEVAEFAKELQPHQVARLPSVKGLVVEDSSDDEDDVGGMAVDEGEKRSERVGPETVLDRAVMEHNLLSCSKVRLASVEHSNTSIWRLIRQPLRPFIALALCQHHVCWPRRAARPRACRRRVSRPADDRARAAARLDRVRRCLRTCVRFLSLTLDAARTRNLPFSLAVRSRSSSGSRTGCVLLRVVRLPSIARRSQG